MSTTIQQKRGTAANWASKNPILLDGEIGLETDTHKIKAGNGTSHWNDLPYIKPNSADVAYTHHQNAQLQAWHITHPLSFIPNVVITDVNGNILEADVDYVGTSEIFVTLSEAYSGYAYLS